MHLDSNNLFPNEPIAQKRCRRGSFGCKDQLLVNHTLENCICRHKNLSKAWIDYKKLFHSVPNLWILTTLQLFEVSLAIQNFMQYIVTVWNTGFIASFQ